MSDEFVGEANEDNQSASTQPNLVARINGILVEAEQAALAWNRQLDAQKVAGDPEAPRQHAEIITETVVLEPTFDFKRLPTEPDDPDATGSGRGDSDDGDDGGGDDGGGPSGQVCAIVADNCETSQIQPTGGANMNIGNYWGGWYWPTYNRDRVADTGSAASYFRHYCMRVAVVDYDLDTSAVTPVTAFSLEKDSAVPNPCNVPGSDPYLIGAEIPDWYFLDTITDAALDELIVKLTDYWSAPPPDTGKIRLTIYMEMHREFAYSYAVQIYPPNPPGHTEVGRNASRGGRALKVRMSPHEYIGDAIGDETSSVPVVLKACWEAMS